MTTKNIKVIFSAAIMGAFMLVSQAKAQCDKSDFHHKDGKDHSKKQTEWMKTELSLNDDQTAKVETINKKYAEKRKAMHEEHHKQGKALREEQDKELQGVLTKEQYAKLEAKKAEMKEKRKQAHKEKKGTNK